MSEEPQYDLSKYDDEALKTAANIFKTGLFLQNLNSYTIIALGIAIAIIGPSINEPMGDSIAKLFLVGFFYWVNSFLVQELAKRKAVLEKELEKRRLKKELRPR